MYDVSFFRNADYLVQLGARNNTLVKLETPSMCRQLADVHKDNSDYNKFKTGFLFYTTN